MRVLFVIDSLEPGGAELSLAAVLPLLDGVEARVCHLYPGDSLAPRLRSTGIGVTSCDLPGRYAPLAAYRALRREVRRWRPDLLHSQLWRSGIVARVVARRSSVPLIHTLVNEPLTAPSRPTGGKWKSRLLEHLDRATAGWVDLWIANSTPIADAHVAALGLPRERLRVIHRGRDAQVFAPRKDDADGTAPAGGPLLLNVGRLRTAKGQDLLLDALPAVLAEQPTARLLIAGEGPARDALEERSRRRGVAGAVHLPGHCDDIPELLRSADLFVFPSRHEGHPGALVEAMLCALPILASDIPVHRETLRHGESGLLLPLGDAAAWSRAVLAILGDRERARSLGRAARREAVERFDLRRIARRHTDLYRSLAARREPAS